jgi:hypothetical protein
LRELSLIKMINKWAITAVFLFCLPTMAFAHGEQLMALPLSGVIAIVAGIPIILALGKRNKRDKLSLPLWLILMIAMVIGWFMVSVLVDPVNFYEHFWIYTIALAVFPIGVCALVSQVMSRQISKINQRISKHNRS